MDAYGWLRQNSIFDSFADAELSNLVTDFEPRVFQAGEFLCRQGDDATGMFVMTHGLVDVFVRTIDGSQRLIGEVGSHELFGEIGLITGEPRSASGQAARDTIALEMSAEAYRRLSLSHPDLTTRIVRLIVNRLRVGTKSKECRRTYTVAVLPVSDVPVVPFCEQLVAALSARIPTLAMNQEQFMAGCPVANLEESARFDEKLAMARHLGEISEPYACLVSACDAAATSWTRFSLRNADLILILGNADENPAPGELERELLSDKALRRPIRKDLVLLTRQKTNVVGNTLQWASLRSIELLSHVRLGVADDFSSLIAPIVEGTSVPVWLRSSVLFSSFDETSLRSLVAELENVELHGQELLFEQESEGDGLFLVVSGRLQAFLKEKSGQEKILREMGPGDVIGEIALITGEPRTAAVRAVRDTKLAKLSKTSFDRLARANPQLVFQLARVIVDRMGGRVTRVKKMVRSVNYAVVPLSCDFDSNQFLKSLTDGLSRLGRARAISSSLLDGHLGEGSSSIDKTHPGDSTVVEWLNQLESEYDFLVYFCDPSDTPWTRRCLRQADRILLVAPASAGPRISPIEKQLFDGLGASQRILTYLILVHDEQARGGNGTLSWLTGRNLERHFHVRSNNTADFCRTARLLTGKAFGLALAGGGSRGAAHLGVYRALLDAGISVDIVSGTSAGAAIAGLISLGDSPDIADQKITRLLSSPWGHVLSMGPPFVSMMSGRHANRLLEPLYGDRMIEDQFIPCTMVSTDLSEGRVWAHRTGLLREAARASSSLPAAWPPITVGGHLLVDGGILNNLPVDFVKPMCIEGYVIASDIGSDKDFAEFEQYGLELSGWALLRNRLNPFRNRRKLPSIMEVISRCCTLASAGASQKYMGDERLLYLSLPVSEYGMFSIRDARTVRDVSDRAYEFATKHLATLSGKPSR